jgi:hypothetical protein
MQRRVKAERAMSVMSMLLTRSAQTLNLQTPRCADCWAVSRKRPKIKPQWSAVMHVNV